MISRHTMIIASLRRVKVLVSLLVVFGFTTVGQSQCPLICNKNVNISMEGTCNVEVTPAMVVEGFVSGSCTYTVVIMGSNGLPIPSSPFVDSSHVGRSFDVKIQYDHNSCWGKIHVEDKFAPVITCPPVDTLNCYDRRTFPLPTATDNCGTIKSVNILSDDIEDLGCSQAYAAIRRISYIAFDKYDNKSAVCTRVVYYRKIRLDSIDFPKDRDDQSAHSLSCDNKENWDKNNNKYPEPSESGVPTDKTGASIQPDVAFCDLKVSFTDSEIVTCGASRKIFRSWTILDWCSRQVRTKIQTIKISDHEAPEASVNHVDGLKVNANAYECAADWTVPAPRNFVDCGESMWSIGYVVADQFGSFPANPFYTEENVVKVGANTIIRRLPVGKVRLRYRLFDPCGNSRFKFVDIEVIDRNAPDVVCNEFIVVTIGSETDVNIPASSLDNGSLDRCSKVSFTALRMNQGCSSPTSWSNFFKVCCSDVGQDVMVSLRVTDESGNFNTCMVTVRVQDKKFPKVTCPPDVTIQCGTHPDTFRITGMATATDNCATPRIFKVDSSALNNCGVGMIFRKWYAEDNNKNRDSCIQKITITPLPRLTLSDTIWRRVRDTMIEACMEYDIDPRITGEPNLPGDKCRQLGANYKDQIFYKVDSVCAKILRQWTVVDWCDTNPNENKIFYTQVIKIVNTRGPEFSNCRDTTFCIDGACNGNITYVQSATDVCTPVNKLVWTYQVDLNNNGTIDRSGTTPNASGNYPVGKHRIIWKVKDGCGNESKCERILTITDCKKPTPYCIGEITTVIMPSTGTVSIWAKDFDLGSSDNCPGKLKISFSADVKDTMRTFNCNQLGQRDLQMWVTDTTGNQDFCAVKINIQDGDNNCNKTGNAFISGKIMTENSKGLDQTEVSLMDLSDNFMNMSMSDALGQFTFQNISDGSYTLKPKYGKNHLLGINTIDLVHIQRHILGIQRLTNPYKLIAADADNDERITISDVVELRKLILGIKSQFDNDDLAWKFVSNDNVFANPAKPWPFKGSSEVNIANGIFSKNIEFMAVKVGDLDGSAFALSSRNTNKITVTSATKSIDKRTYDMSFKVKEDVSIDALEMMIDLPSRVSKVILSSNMIDLNSEHYFVDYKNGKIKVSWHSEKEVNLLNSNTLINITYEAQSEETLSLSNSNNTNFIHSTTNGTQELINERNHTKSFEVYQNEPNPFEDRTRIRFYQPMEGEVKLNIYNLTGKALYQSKKVFGKGINEIEISKQDIKEKGVIIYEMELLGEKVIKKMLLI